MGLGAFVRCDCWEAGRTSEPPVPRERLYITENDQLAIEYECDGDEDEFDDDGEKVSEWLETACEHPGMCYAAKHIPSWDHFTEFLEVLMDLGEHRFPSLLPDGSCYEEDLTSSGDAVEDLFPDLLPDYDRYARKLTVPGEAAQALEELAYFRSLPDVVWVAYLVDSGVGDPLRTYSTEHEFSSLRVGDVCMEFGVEEFEFIVREASTERPLFHATRFRQTPLEPEQLGPDEPEGSVELLDLDTGERFRFPRALGEVQFPWPDGRWEDEQGQGYFLVPTKLHVEERIVTPRDFDDIVTVLEAVFRASVETGNPVRWC